MQGIYRSKRVKHTAQRIQQESATVFSPIFNGASFHSLGIGGGGGGGGGTGGPGIVGHGSPEGVVIANPGTSYFDIDQTPPGFWSKITGISNTGWQQLIGV